MVISEQLAVNSEQLIRSGRRLRYSEQDAIATTLMELERYSEQDAIATTPIETNC